MFAGGMDSCKCPHISKANVRQSSLKPFSSYHIVLVTTAFARGTTIPLVWPTSTVPALGTSMASIWNALSVSARFNHHSFARGNATSAWGTERNRTLPFFESPAPLPLVIDSTVFPSTPFEFWYRLMTRAYTPLHFFVPLPLPPWLPRSASPLLHWHPSSLRPFRVFVLHSLLPQALSVVRLVFLQ